MKSLLQFLSITVFVLLVNSFYQFVQSHPTELHPTIDIFINGDKYNVCTASTRAEQLLGINNPSCRDGAMFYFDEPQRYAFTMVDVGYPLKLLTLDENWNIQEVILMAPGILKISPEKPFKFALELKDIETPIKINDVVLYIDA